MGQTIGRAPLATPEVALFANRESIIPAHDTRKRGLLLVSADLPGHPSPVERNPNC